jgi:hypothetical protein
MFKHFSLESTKQIFITLYCKGSFEDCQRKKLRDKGAPVPETLLPDGQILPVAPPKPV